MKNTKYIAPPITFKIEMTHGCNLKCKFCPVYASEELQKSRDYMTREKMRDIMVSIAKLRPDGGGRIELTRRGEPTLNPYILDNVRIMRGLMPDVQISMFSNGTEFLRTKSHRLMVDLIDAGLNILNIDCYNNTYDRFRDIARSIPDGSNIEQKDFRKFSAYQRHSGWHRLRIVNLVPDIANPKQLVAVRKIHNAAGIRTAR